MNQTETLAQLKAFVRQTATLESVLATLEWDQQTYMPDQAGDHRSEQVAMLAAMVHQRKTDAQLGEWLSNLDEGQFADGPESDDATTVRMVRRAFERQSKIPESLVTNLAKACSKGQQQWTRARHEQRFDLFADTLEEIVRLKQQQADAISFEASPYDALLDEYEPGMTVAKLTPILAGLRSDLVPLIAAIADSSCHAPVELLRRQFPVTQQEVIGRQAAREIGFDFERGRLDVTHHPFCTELGPNDTRITTRYDESFFSGSFFGTLHEAGHGIYQQGLRSAWYGLPPGTYVSLGMHESQSRLWENQVGRSQPFWQYFFPKVQAAFASTLQDVTVDSWFFAVNHVAPSLIRVEADEATYNLHIIIRFELEQSLIGGQLSVKDLPEAWNQKYRDYLGIEPANDAEGVLQDVHWSAGLFGYFPTYTLGNLYAAQLFDAADKELGGLPALIAQGEFTPLRNWLQEKIHRKGQTLDAATMARQATGEELSHQALLRHLRAKLAPLYQLD